MNSPQKTARKWFANSQLKPFLAPKNPLGMRQANQDKPRLLQPHSFYKKRDLQTGWGINPTAIGQRLMDPEQIWKQLLCVSQESTLLVFAFPGRLWVALARGEKKKRSVNTELTDLWELTHWPLDLCNALLHSSLQTGEEHIYAPHVNRCLLTTRALCQILWTKMVWNNSFNEKLECHNKNTNPMLSWVRR